MDSNMIPFLSKNPHSIISIDAQKEPKDLSNTFLDAFKKLQIQKNNI